MPISQRYPLLTLLKVEAAQANQIKALLAKSSISIIDDLQANLGKKGISAEVTRLQLYAQKAAIKAQMDQDFRNIEVAISNGKIAAAKAASGVVSEYEKTLQKLVTSPEEIARIAKSEARRAASGLDAAMQRMAGSSYTPLSKQVYKTKQLASGWVDETVNRALLQGWSQKRLAKEVSDSFNPNVSGGVSYAANRLARTEINNAFHASSAQRYLDSPIVELVDWSLSSSHPEGDICDDMVKDGPYKKNQVPKKPHPHCYCFIVPKLPTEEEFLENLFDGKYDDEPFAKVAEKETGVDFDKFGKLTYTQQRGKIVALERKLGAKAVDDPTVKEMNRIAFEKLQKNFLAEERATQLKRQQERLALAKARRENNPVAKKKVATPVRGKAAVAAKGKMAAAEPFISTKGKVEKLPQFTTPNKQRTLAQARLGANPRGPGKPLDTKQLDYRINCTRVSAAMELRVRGYDVSAGAANKLANKSDAHILSNWIDPKTGRNRSYTMAYDKESLISKIEENPEGSRFMVVAPWKKGGAHIWNAEVKNGKMEFYEGQTKGGEVVPGILTRRYLQAMDFNHESGAAVRFFRVDDLEPTDQLVNRGWIVNNPLNK